jgi:hypothetical protein
VGSGCRDDLVQVNGAPVPVAIRGARDAARRGLDLVGCDPSLALPRGSNTLVSSEGLASGWNIDRVVLTSDDAGRAAPVTTAGAPRRDRGAEVRVVGSSPDSYHLRVRTDGKPFWLVLGQSHNDGWEATAEGQDLGTPTLVNGFANGWLVRPGAAGSFDVVLRWTPQRLVWIGLGISALAVLACLMLVFVRRRRALTEYGPVLLDKPRWSSPTSFACASPSLSVAAAAAVGAGIATALFSRWWIGLLVAIATIAASRLTRGRLLLAAGAPLALALGALVDIPELGWIALGLLLADLVAGWWFGRSHTRV